MGQSLLDFKGLTVRTGSRPTLPPSSGSVSTHEGSMDHLMTMMPHPFRGLVGFRVRKVTFFASHHKVWTESLWSSK